MTTYRDARYPVRSKPKFAHPLGYTVFNAVIILLLSYFLQAAWLSLFLWIGVRASGAETWTYLYTLTHWGLLTPLALNIVRKALT